MSTADFREVILPISVVIPTVDSSGAVTKLIDSLSRQVRRPSEIVIIDSSDDNKTEAIVSGNSFEGKLIYKRIDKAYPGKARNFGVQIAQCDWVAFLDSQTIPNADWLSDYSRIATVQQVDVVFGLSKAESSGSFQSILRATSYGIIPHVTVPGTLIKRSAFLESGGFIENVRAGEDLEWKDRMERGTISTYVPETCLISYYGLTKTMREALRKYVISSFHNARIAILSDQRDAYVSVLIIFITILVTKWNHLIGGWDANPLYIPHITKLYLLSISFFLIVYTLLRLFFHIAGQGRIFTLTLKMTIFSLFSGLVYKWNAVFAGWVEEAVWYIPHITKIYVSALVTFSTIYRGLILPRKRGVSTEYLFPFRWIAVGLLGLMLDVAKAFGFVFGAFRGLFQSLHLVINRILSSAN